MSYFNRTGDTLEEQHEDTRPAGSRLADLGDRIARAFTGAERGRTEQPDLFADDEIDAGVPVSADTPKPEAGDRFAPRFPVGPFGYSRAAVDEYLAEVERELDDLRRDRPVEMTINEEIERLGEQTASILVVAHDQANETTRRAREQADRCIADAAANAVAITEKAKRQLHEIDNETDAVWHERRRLIEDVRSTATAMLALADDAVERFPEEAKPETVESPELPDQ